MANAVYRYCAQVNKSINCPRRLKKAFLQQLRNEARFFCEEQGKADIQGLYEKFGMPEVVAEEFLAELNPAASAKSGNRCKTALKAVIAIVLLTVGFVCILVIQNQKIQQRIDEEFIASIIYEEDIKENRFWIPFQDFIFWNTSK